MNHLKRILIKGGILSPSELKQIISYTRSLGLNSFHFGSRQDIILPEYNCENDQHPLVPETIKQVNDIDYQNIVCSYLSADIFESTPWLKGSTYLYILESFKYTPQLKINITDPKQRLIPLFSGELNFIASPHEDYWYLKLNLPHWQEAIDYPVLIYTWDISLLSETLEKTYKEAENVDELFLLINDQIQTNNRTIERELKIPYHPFPYYEGMNKMGIKQYWLGLYWRNNQYDIEFLDKFCDFCLENKIGKICISPWKSFIVKGIPTESKTMLEKFLGKAGINVRHSLLELNWHLPVADQEALSLKKFIVMNFDQNDISTYGLTFGIANRQSSKSYFSAIMIEKNKTPDLIKSFKVRPTYNVIYSKNFDPNNQKYIVYAQDVDKIELPGLLMELSKKYFDQLGQNDSELVQAKKTDPIQTSEVHQCQNCLTIYDKVMGEPEMGIDQGTLFSELPLDYQCPVCSSDKKLFRKVNIAS